MAPRDLEAGHGGHEQRGPALEAAAVRLAIVVLDLPRGDVAHLVGQRLLQPIVAVDHLGRQLNSSADLPAQAQAGAGQCVDGWVGGCWQSAKNRRVKAWGAARQEGSRGWEGGVQV